MMAHPLRKLHDEWLPEYDFAVLAHGFAAHGRDYHFVVQTAGRGTDRVILTHVPMLRYETALTSGVWRESWDDVYLDYERAQDLRGYVWGTNWSMAYPGLTLLEGDPDVQHWSETLGREMHGALLETDRFKLKAVFSDARSESISGETDPMNKVMFPI